MIGAHRWVNSPIIGRMAWFFPPELDAAALYPESTVMFTDEDTGTTTEVQCFIPDFEVEIEELQCPSPFVSKTNK